MVHDSVYLGYTHVITLYLMNVARWLPGIPVSTSGAMAIWIPNGT